MPKIDVHTHIVPDTLPAQPGRSDAWPSVEIRSQDDAAVMVRGKVFRAIDSRSWNVERRIEDMREDGVDIQVLSPMPELLSHWLPAEEADDLCKIVNDHIAKMIAARPDRFRGIGMVPMQDPERAAKRLEDLRSLGLLGVEIGTHINGIALGDERLQAFFAAAEALGLVVFVHPLHPVGVERIGGKREFAAISAFPLETAFATVSLIGARLFERFPRLRVLLSHGGGAAAWIFPRIDFACSAGSLLKDYLPEPAARTVRRFWYDTITYDDEALGYLASRVGGERLVVGSDYPFLIRQPRPVAFAEHALPDVNFDANAAALFAR
jgi:aminocarboxymuconate-semialdehyde decarboxylase